MLTLSENHNPNYLAKIVRLKGVRKHENADRLQCVEIDFNTVVTGLDAKNGDVYVYFPIECKINKEFLSKTNSFRDKELNVQEETGFFEANCRVRAMKLRGEKSMGYIVPVHTLTEVYGTFGELESLINTEFDTVNGVLLLEKYEIKTRIKGSPNLPKGQNSIIVDNQINLHVDTLNLRKHSDKVLPNDLISISYKTHGTSFWVSNVLTKVKLSMIDKFLIWLGFNIKTLEYGIVYGSRKVVKNRYSNHLPKGFYGKDIWGIVAKELEGLIPEGFTLYGEILGYTPSGKSIQAKYDYGNRQNEHSFEIYRITHTTPKGIVTELSWNQIKEFCTKVNIKSSYHLFYGRPQEILPFTEDLRKWQSDFVKLLEEKYNDKDCFMCKNKVPEEGIVLRKQSLFNFEAYKLKSFRFLEKESKQLDIDSD